MGSTDFVISLGGSGFVVLVARVRLAPWLYGLPEENDGERLDLSRRASDQLNPSADSQYMLASINRAQMTVSTMQGL